MRRLVGLISGMLVLWAGGSSAFAVHPDPPPWVPLATGNKAPRFVLTTLTGGSWSLAAAHGHVIWLIFLTSWCSWCGAQARWLAYAGPNTPQPPTTVLVDEGESRRRMEYGLETAHAWPAAVPIVLDQQGEVARRYGVQAYPTSYFIAANGTIRGVYLGPILRWRLLTPYLHRAGWPADAQIRRDQRKPAKRNAMR